MAHSVARVWPTRDRASARMLRDPGRWTGTSLMPFRSQNFKSQIVRWVSRNDLVPPSLLMYETTMALSHIRRTTRDLSWSRNRVTLRNTASISNRFICWLACCGDHFPCSVREPSCTPIRDWRHLWIKLSLSLGHSVKTPAAPQERPNKAPDGEWSGSLKSFLTRTSPGTIPLMPTTGLGGGVVDLLAQEWPWMSTSPKVSGDAWQIWACVISSFPGCSGFWPTFWVELPRSRHTFWTACR